MEQKSNTFTQIYDIVRQIPYGKVATYGQIAELAGNKRLSRVVGYALHVNPDPDGIPCYRVVNRFGAVSPAFAFGGENRQIGLLEAEGIKVTDGIVRRSTDAGSSCSRLEAVQLKKAELTSMWKMIDIGVPPVFRIRMYVCT